MPYSETQRRAAFAELSRRKKGKGGRMFGGMGAEKLEEYAHSPLEKKRKRGRGRPPSGAAQAAALRHYK